MSRIAIFGLVACLIGQGPDRTGEVPEDSKGRASPTARQRLHRPRAAFHDLHAANPSIETIVAASHDTQPAAGSGGCEPRITVYHILAQVPVPDNSSSGVTDVFEVLDSAIIIDLDFDVRIDHTWVGDLVVTLTHAGAVATLIDRPGYPAINFGSQRDGLDVILDDEATQAIEDIPTGDGPAVVSPPNYAPNEDLSAFDGLDAAGEWIVRVSDNAPDDIGTLVGWSLHLTVYSEPCFFEACCLPDSSCMDLAFDVCLDSDGIPLGSGSACATAECALQACCDEFGFCENLPPLACLNFGTPQGEGTTCATTPCPAQACCTPEGTCSDLAPKDCLVLGGLPLGPRSQCPSAACEPFEACCTGFGDCVPTLPDMCTDSGGAVQGPGTDCANTSCPVEACCSQLGCDELVPHSCLFSGGFPLGAGSVCANTPCPTQACCSLDDGTCQDLRADECDGFPPRGFGTACESTDCALQACCFRFAVIGATCIDIPAAMCTDGFLPALPLGPGTSCETNACPAEACCLPEGGCNETPPAECPGAPLGIGTTCDTAVCDLQACCSPTGCADLPSRTCTGLVRPGVALGPGTACATATCPEQACCLEDGGCLDLSPDDCLAEGRALGVGTACAFADCMPQACCSSLVGIPLCVLVPPAVCLGVAGDPQGAGTDCIPASCLPIAIISSDPPDGAIDARQPTDHDGLNPQGWDAIEILLSAGASTVRTADFEIVASGGQVPLITEIRTELNRATVRLDSPVPLGECTTLHHIPSGMRIRLGRLPGDIDGDGASNTADVAALIDHLNGVDDPPLEIWQCDINQSGLCEPQDLLRAIDLLNGADAFEPWDNMSLPACWE